MDISTNGSRGSKVKLRKSIFPTSRHHSTISSKHRSVVKSSLSSIRSGQDSNSTQPMELSWETFTSKEGFTSKFVKIFCEKVRTGDHFKTLKIIESTTVEQCIKELVENYFSKLGKPDEFQLCEVIGRIEAMATSIIQDPVWSFTEYKVRHIDPSENIRSIFQNTTPGQGLCRRLELRWKENFEQSNRTPRISSRSPKSPNLALFTPPSTPIRTGTPITSRFRDSRRGRNTQINQMPNGPHLLLLRGHQPKLDMLVYDLTKIISDNGLQPFLTIGDGPDANIQLHPVPNEKNTLSNGYIYARLSGYPMPINNTERMEIKGIICLEPDESALRSKIDENLSRTPEIYVNNQLIKPLNENFFTKRVLHPGDIIHFGSKRHGYIFLFKDPRWIPDHQLELPFTNERITQSNTVITDYVTCRKQNDNYSTLKYRFLPDHSELQWIIKGLFISVKVASTSDRDQPNTLLIPIWNAYTVKMEPSRAACLLAHLMRVVAMQKINPTVAEDSNLIDDKLTNYQNIPTNLLNQLGKIFTNYHNNMVNSTENRVVPWLWLCVFYYDLAIYLSPGWLTQPLSLSRPSNGNTDPSNVFRFDNESTGSFSSFSSLNSATSLKNIEGLPELEELRTICHDLAEHCMEKILKLLDFVILPLVPTLYQGFASSLLMNQYNNYPVSTDSTSELSHVLDQLISCIDTTFYPYGMNELLGQYSKELFNGVSKSLSDISQDIDMDINQNGYMHNHVNNGHSTKPQSYRIDSPFENDSTDSPISQTLGGKQSGKFELSLARVQTVLWRQILAAMSYEVLYNIFFTGSLKIDYEFGMNLLFGVNWLQDWLQVHKLEYHKRPLNILIQCANLLATPSAQLYKMSWSSMRTSYPDIPPAVLRFLLEEYEQGIGMQNTVNWRIEPIDANAVDEDPLDVIDLWLKSWKSKERLRSAKILHQTAPLSRPLDPDMLFKQASMKKYITELDEQLKNNQDEQILFRWQELLRRFAPPKVISQQLDIPSTLLRNRLQHKQSLSSRRRLPLKVNNRLDRQDHVGPKDTENLFRSSPNLIHQSDELVQSETQITDNKMSEQHRNSQLSLNEFRDNLRPLISEREPMYRGAQNFAPDQNSLNNPSRNQQTIHQLNKSKSLHNGDVNHLSNSCHNAIQSPKSKNYWNSNYNRGYDPEHNYDGSPVRNLPLALEDFTYPPERIFPQSPQYYEFPRNATPNTARQWYMDSRLQLPNGLAQSLNDFHGNLPGYRKHSVHDSISRLDLSQLREAENDWKQYRITALGQSMDKLRNMRYMQTRSVTPNLMRGRYGQVSSSLSQLPQSYGNVKSNFRRNNQMPPSLVIQEASDMSSDVVSELEHPRNDEDSDSTMGSINHLDASNGKGDDLSDVLTRSSLGSAVTNVTLSRPDTQGFGLSLIDGERTHLDQPGVFVKSVAPGSVASQNGNFSLGDRILAINGNDLTGMTYRDALALLKQCGNQATFTVLRCNLSDPNQLLRWKD